MLHRRPTHDCQGPQASSSTAFIVLIVREPLGRQGITNLKDRPAVVSGFRACSQVLSHPVHSAHCLSSQRSVLTTAPGWFPSAIPITPTKLLARVMHRILPALSSTGVGARGSLVHHATSAQCSPHSSDTLICASGS